MEERVAEAEWMMDGAVTTRRRSTKEDPSSEGKRPPLFRYFFKNVLNTKKE